MAASGPFKRQNHQSNHKWYHCGIRNTLDAPIVFVWTLAEDTSPERWPTSASAICLLPYESSYKHDHVDRTVIAEPSTLETAQTIWKWYKRWPNIVELTRARTVFSVSRHACCGQVWRYENTTSTEKKCCFFMTFFETKICATCTFELKTEGRTSSKEHALRVDCACIIVACILCVSFVACYCSVQLWTVWELFCAVKSADCFADHVERSAESSVSCRTNV